MEADIFSLLIDIRQLLAIAVTVLKFGIAYFLFSKAVHFIAMFFK